MSNTDTYEELSDIEICRQSLLSYCTAIYPPFVAPKHILYLIKKLEAVERGEIKRLIIFAPPRHGKSELVSKLFPSWYIGRNPEKHAIIATYNQDLSDTIGGVLNARMNTDLYKEIFPKATPGDSKNGIRETITRQGGGFFVTGIGGGLTGRGGDLRLIDDPNKNWAEANSDDIQKSQWDWWTSVFYTRGEQKISEFGESSDDDDSPIIIILTRWSDKDIAAKLIKKQKEEENDPDADKWEIVDLPAIALSEDDPLGRPRVIDENDTSTWIDDNALWPGKFNARKLAKIKKGVGIQTWRSLYQQRPSSAQGNVYKRDSWKFYSELPADADITIGSWDCNYHKTTDSDMAVGLVAGVQKKTNIYIRDMFRGRWTFPELCKQILKSKMLYPEMSGIYVERKAAGQPVISTLEDTIPGLIGVDPEALGSKDSRNQACGHHQNAGNIYLPLSAVWRDDVIEETAAWPNGEYDDICDCLAMLVLKELGAPDFEAIIRLLEAELREAGIDTKALREKTDDTSINELFDKEDDGLSFDDLTGNFDFSNLDFDLNFLM